VSIGEINRVDAAIASVYHSAMADLLALGGVTLTQLTYLVAVDAHRHFGAAAAACHVTQPTLSMQLAKLERLLGVTLFDRSRSPAVPTEVGRLMVEQARVVLREAARLIDVRDAVAGMVAGELRLGVIPTLAPYLLPRILPELHRRHPQLELVVEERVTDDVIEGLRRDTLDAGIIATSAATTDMVERVLFTEPFVAYVSPSHRLAGQPTVRAADLSLDDLWLLAEGHCLRAQTVRLCRQRATRGARPELACTTGARFESGNLETLKRLVEGGTGMTLLPSLAAGDLATDAQRALLRPFAHPAPSRDVRLVEQRAQHRRHLVDAFVQVLLEALPPELRPARPVPASAGAGTVARRARAAHETLGVKPPPPRADTRA
jgi:LysR family hydrogen peroxide-inducible transcriptional activator